MRTHQAACVATTTEALDIVDVTLLVEEIVTASGILQGQVTVFVADTSCVLLVNERESGLLIDLRRALERLGSNGRAAVIGSSSLVLPAAEGRLRLGTWQRLLLLELVEAESRSVVVQIVGE